MAYKLDLMAFCVCFLGKSFISHKQIILCDFLQFTGQFCHFIPCMYSIITFLSNMYKGLKLKQFTRGITLGCMDTPRGKIIRSFRSVNLEGLFRVTSTCLHCKLDKYPRARGVCSYLPTGFNLWYKLIVCSCGFATLDQICNRFILKGFMINIWGFFLC